MAEADNPLSVRLGRVRTLDVLRGVAVMGILLMNIIAFSMPEPAYVNPRAWGGMTGADQSAWVLSFIFIDSKMRSLFSILFGASMLLFVERAEDKGEDAIRLHLRRMGWLLLIGWLHYALIWDGDILTLYAAMGLIALVWRGLDVRSLFKVSAILFGAALLLWASIILGVYQADAKAGRADATAKEKQEAREVRADFGEPGSKSIAHDLRVFRASYPVILKERATKNRFAPLELIMLFGFETLGLIALGMALLKNGFLIGTMGQASYRKTASICLAIGISAMGGLTIWCVGSGYEVMTTATANLLWSLPFRALIAVGYAALIIMAVKAWPKAVLLRRIEAAGQAAFTNYLGTSMLMTFIFYGYGLGLYGHVPRHLVYILVPFAWAAMLMWSQPWIDRYRHGPLEWVWRSLTRWEWAPMRRTLLERQED